MGSAADPANDGTPRKASEWLVALKDDPANGELHSQFERWLAASPVHARDWAEMDAEGIILPAKDFLRMVYLREYDGSNENAAHAFQTDEQLYGYEAMLF